MAERCQARGKRALQPLTAMRFQENRNWRAEVVVSNNGSLALLIVPHTGAASMHVQAVRCEPQAPHLPKGRRLLDFRIESAVFSQYSKPMPTRFKREQAASSRIKGHFCRRTVTPGSRPSCSRGREDHINISHIYIYVYRDLIWSQKSYTDLEP